MPVFRRFHNVLAALLLVAGLVFPAPVLAVDGAVPEPSYLASFDACEGVAPSGFVDLPGDQAQIDNINCIAHWGITRGTSATTYSPDSAVTREQMALFLIRLAGRVGIDVPSQTDARFRDIGHLNAGSREAINQLAQLGITKGTTLITYSPAGVVTRGQMALFIQRLMDKMEPLGNDEQIFGYTPALVVDTAEREVAAPFTDLEDVTKDTFDAVTHLYELGVVTGISATEYEPETVITRATMADFMAAVLDHSNLRPAGLHIRAVPLSDYGSTDVAVMVSMRDSNLGPVAGQAVDVFATGEENRGFDDQGVCLPGRVIGDCTWGVNDDVTDTRGNIWVTVRAEEDGTSVYYAWIGLRQGERFDVDEADGVSASVTPRRAETDMKVTSTIPEHADGNTVHIARTGSVTLTVQLVDFEDKPVARPGIDIEVGLEQLVNDVVVNRDRDEAVLTTDEDGEATFRIEGPENDADAANQNRTDRITFRYAGEDRTGLSLADVPVTIQWIKASRQTHKAVAEAPDYVRVSADEVSIRASVTFYDQYGVGHRTSAGQQAGMTFGTEEVDVPVNSSGKASRTVTLDRQSRGFPVTVSFTADPDGDGVDLDSGVGDPPDAEVQVVTAATSRDAGEDMSIHTLFSRFNRFTTEAGGGNSDAKLLFYYKRSDTFLAGVQTITIEQFEDLLTPFEDEDNLGVVDIVTYDREGTSVFKIVRTADNLRP